MYRKKIGEFSPELIKILHLDVSAGTPIYIADSIEFTKEYLLDGTFVKVAVRVSLQNIYYARSLYVLNANRVKNFIAKGTLIKLDK